MAEMPNGDYNGVLYCIVALLSGNAGGNVVISFAC